MTLPRELLRRAAQNRTIPQPVHARTEAHDPGVTLQAYEFGQEQAARSMRSEYGQLPPQSAAWVGAGTASPQEFTARPSGAAGAGGQSSPLPPLRPPVQPHHATYSALMRSHDRMRTNHLPPRPPEAKG